MAAWRFLAFDLVTGLFLGELPVTGGSCADMLDPGDDSFDLTIALDKSGTIDILAAIELADDDGEIVTDDDESTFLFDDPTPISVPVSNRAVTDATRRGRTVIVFERNGAPLFSGIIWRRRYIAGSGTVAVAGAGLWSYYNGFTRPPYSGAPATVTQDQFDWVRAWAAECTDVDITFDAVDSGVDRERVFDPDKPGPAKPYGELMREMAMLEDGFDFDIRVEYIAGLADRRCRLFYPRRGRTVADGGPRFTYPGNVLGFSFDDDGTDMAATLLAVGGEAEYRFSTTASRTDLIAAGWPAYSAYRERPDISDPATLTEFAESEIAYLSGVDREVYGITVHPDGLARGDGTLDGSYAYGTWEIGDDCILVVENDPFFPAASDGTPGLVVQRRVIGHRWSINDAGETLEVVLGEKVIP